MSILSYIQQGGPVMYILLSLSVFAVAIALYKFAHFALLGVWKHNLVDDALEHLKAGRVKESLTLLDRSKKPCAIVTRAAIATCMDQNLSKSDITAEVERLGTLQLRAMESYLRGLSVIAHLTPLLGLLGTVIGMISAFIALEQSGGAANPTLLAGGIWVALLTTAFGLAIAIPSLGLYYFFESEVDKVKARMKDSVTQVLVLFNQTGCGITKISKTNLTDETYGF